MPFQPTFDALVAAALERMAAENAQSARTARAAKLTDDAKFFQRAANAFVRALEEWTAGTRPTRTPSGGWLLPSRSGGAAHLLSLDGDWMCSCAAGESMHWAKALVIGMEVASDDLDRFDDGAAIIEENPDSGPSSPAAPAAPLPTAPPDAPTEADDPRIMHVEDARAARQALIRRLTEARGRRMREAA